jgi:L-2-hydroxyglutarate oxidase LhgO
MDRETTDSVIIGAGVIGLALARALAQRGREVVVFDSAPNIGAGISSRNSGVLHAGLYYPNNSLKSLFCVAGQKRLYDYVTTHGIQYKQCGKLVVAITPDQSGGLHALKENAERNGVKNLQLLSGAEAKKIEPELHCHAALLVPQSGMFDVHHYLSALHADLDQAGAVVMLNTEITAAEATPAGFTLTTQGKQHIRIDCKTLVNAAGLGAQEMSARLTGLDKSTIPEQLLVKGNYFKLHGTPSPFQKLIYPVPVPGYSGLHTRLDFDNQTVFGPDHEPLNSTNWHSIKYEVAPERLETFETTIRTYWPGLPANALAPDYSGVRPKLKRHNDFIVQGPHQHGLNGYFALYGIESPGLTASLALGESLARAITPEFKSQILPDSPDFPQQL